MLAGSESWISIGLVSILLLAAPTLGGTVTAAADTQLVCSNKGFESSSTTAHFIICYHSGFEGTRDFLSGALEEGFPFVVSKVGYQPQSPIAVFIASTPEEYVKIGNTPPQAQPTPGMSSGQWSNGVLSFYNPLSFKPFVVHELTHAVEGPYMTFNRPSWWMEGLAVYVAYRFAGQPGPASIDSDLFGLFVSAFFSANNIGLTNLTDLESTIVHSNLDYSLSASFFLFVEDNFGPQKITTLIQTVKANQDVHVGIASALNTTFPTAQENWKANLTRSIRTILDSQKSIAAARTAGATTARAETMLSQAVGLFNDGRFAAGARLAAEAVKSLGSQTSTTTIGSVTSTVTSSVTSSTITSTSTSSEVLTNQTLYVAFGVAVASLAFATLFAIRRRR